MIMGKRKKLIIIIGTLILGLAILSACGDSTATPASSGAAAPTSSNNTKAATTPAGTTAAITTTAVTTTTIIGPNLSSVAGLTEVPISDAFRQAASSQLNLGNIDLHCYTSDSDPNAITTNFDTALTGQGYQFSIPGMSKPIAQGEANFGVYSNSANGSDVILIVAPVPSNIAANDANSVTSLPGLNQDEVKQLLSQVQGHKTFALTFTGSNLIQGLLSKMTNSGDSANSTSTTPVTTP